MKKIFKCIDAGGEYCPCFLAETDNCITCSMLQGKGFCDCNWCGSCIYQNYVWNGNKKKTPRESVLADIVEKKLIHNGCYQLKIKVSKTLARYLKHPGAYVFIRNIDCEHYFDLPMSVLDVDDTSGYIYIAYQIVGSKTKQLYLADNKLLLRGPYLNGLLGLKNIKVLRNNNCFIVCRGIAQAPSVLLIKYLLKKENNVTVLIDSGNVKEPFIKELIGDYNLNIIEENIMSITGKQLFSHVLTQNKIDFLFLGGSDYMQKTLIDIVDELKVNPLLSATNNHEICCGEGICGACSKRLEDGSIVKTCKTQISVRENIKRRVNLE
ncbi:sulfide/dihydroorotate dehydrogenase-like FAD/NAD-binding protein [Clostridiaceae bacterium M8S5]|nr:sulfide/dihydroorotate dehydrogenase-like FAD/NAD-binding protein [Clostridiaceae bacterium M8S5]